LLDAGGVQPNPNKPPRGIYTSCDAGRTWNWHERSRYQSESDFRTVTPGWFVTSDSSFKAVEREACIGETRKRDIATNQIYHVLSDGTVLQAVPLVHGWKEGVFVRGPNDTAWTSSMPFVSDRSGNITDTSVVFFNNRASILEYRQSAGFRMLDDAPMYNRFQRIAAVGQFGDRLLVQAIIQGAPAGEGTRWTLLNTKTGEVKTHLGSSTVGTSFRLEGVSSILDRGRLVPFTDSFWLASFMFGELVRTTDAGRTWNIVDNIKRDERWGLEWLGVRRLFDRGNGSMVLLNERGRLVMRDSENGKWRISHVSSFVHKSTLPPSSKDIFTSTSTRFGEENGGRTLRASYGPSTVYFTHPDTLWTSGDAILRQTTNGEFIDTILPRRSHVIKKLSPLVTVSAMDSVYFSFNNGKEWVYIGYSLPKWQVEKKRSTRWMPQ